jgi:hypothetical protein
MKKIFSITILLIGFVLNDWGQIALKYENQAIVIGDAHHFLFANKVDEGTAGPNQVWDFSGLKAEGDLTSYMLDAMQTPKGNLIPEANAVIKEGENNFYFRVSKNVIEEYGLASCNAVFRYDQPLVKIKFPFHYGNQCQGQFHGTDVNNPSIQLNGTYKIEADAYGKLILPGNITINDVLRLKSIRTDVAGNSSTTTVTYRWYSSDVRYPLLTIIKYENAGKSNTAVTAYYADAGNVSKSSKNTPEESELIANENIRLKIYPNPYSDKVNINYYLFKQNDVNIAIIDNMGKSICTIVNQNQTEGPYTKSFAGKDYGLKQGIYFVRIIVAGQVITQKIIQAN